MDDRPIFVFGCPRSGTTLLRVMLNAHPHIAIPPENRFVRPVYLGRHRYGPAGSKIHARRVAKAITRRRSGAGHLGASREGLTEAFIDRRPQTVADALRYLFSTYAHDLGKKRWGDKRPSYYSFVDQLDRMFPDAQFVHLVRDGRACVASLQRSPFNYSGGRAIVTWLNAMYAGRRAARRLPPDRLHELKYEDLIAAPEESLRRLCDFLGEPFEPAMLRPDIVVAKHVPAHFQQHGQIAAGLQTSSMHRWEEELPSAQVRCLEFLGASHMKRLGYAASGRRPLALGLTLTCLAAHTLYRSALPLTDWLDRTADRQGPRGRAARYIARRFRPRRLLQAA